MVVEQELQRTRPRREEERRRISGRIRRRQAVEGLEGPLPLLPLLLLLHLLLAQLQQKHRPLLKLQQGLVLRLLLHHLLSLQRQQLSPQPLQRFLPLQLHLHLHLHLRLLLHLHQLKQQLLVHQQHNPQSANT